MVQVRCVDGRTLDVVPVPELDRTGTPYEVTLRLLVDGARHGDVGERCGHLLAGLLGRLRDLPPGALPPGDVERAVRTVAGDAAWEVLRPALPRDAELLCLRARDPDDVTSAGELRVVVSPVRTWADGHGWSERVDVVLTAWGDAGTGVRALLTVPGLCDLLAGLLQECAAVGAPLEP